MKKLSVIIPAYNEARRIATTLQDVADFLSRQVFDYEIIVVNDGSRDNTAAVVANSISSMTHVRFVDNEKNQGKGGAVKDGMLAASGDIRLFMDADNSTKIDEIVKFLPFFDQGYDLVVGSRRIAGAHVPKDQGGLREFLGLVFRTIVHVIVPVGVTDTQCGFKAMTGKAAETIFPKQTIFRWAFDVEILELARKNNFSIKEVPITWVNDEASHVTLSGMMNMLVEVLTVRMNMWGGKYR